MTLYKGNKRIDTIYRRGGVLQIYKGATLVYTRSFDPVTFTENGTWVVPAGIRKIAVDCVAASGNGGGAGGRVRCVLSVEPQTVLYLVVGKVSANWYVAEYNASDVRTTADDLNSRLIVAGGGGSRCNHIASGGAGGGLTGGAGSTTGYVSAGQGGTQESAHTAASGAFGLGGNGNVCGYEGNGGAGGAGWYGGGGGSGAWNKNGAFTSTGGGGSSYTHPTLCTNVEHTQGFNTGNGYITISMA